MTTNTLETRRDYLVRLGLAKPGRGKFSNDGKAALAKAESEGMKFLDNAPAGAAPKPTGNTGPESKPTEKSTENPPKAYSPKESLYLTPDEYRYPESEYRAVAEVGGKKVTYSMRECCNTCRVSLVNHGCESPTIHGNVVVTIVRG